MMTTHQTEDQLQRDPDAPGRPEARIPIVGAVVLATLILIVAWKIFRGL